MRKAAEVEAWRSENDTNSSKINTLSILLVEYILQIAINQSKLA